MFVPDYEAWMEDALCAQTDPELFFPEANSNQGDKAKRICQACPVMNRCLNYAIRNNINHGIWGGRGTRERGRIATRRTA